MIIKLPPMSAEDLAAFQAWRTERLRDVLAVPLFCGAGGVLAFFLWDVAMGAEDLAMAFAVRASGALCIAVCAWRILSEPRTNLTLAVTVTLTAAMGSIALARMAIGDTSYQGNAGLALFPTVSAVAAVRARDVPLINLPGFMAVGLTLLFYDDPQAGVRSLLVFVATGVFAAFVIAEALERADRQSFLLERQLAAEARIDPLTAIPNRRRFEEQAANDWERTRRFDRPLSLLVLDLDHFKQVNDRFGHAAGDEALRLVAERLRGALRRTDLVARLGGEEFAALLPETTLDEASHLAERLRQTVAEASLELPGAVISLTVSIGVATCEEGATTWEEMLAAADRALYAAKRAGRNRVVLARNMPVEPGSASADGPAQSNGPAQSDAPAPSGALGAAAAGR